MSSSSTDSLVDAIDTSTEQPRAAARPKCAAILNGLLRAYKQPRKAELFEFKSAAQKTAKEVVPIPSLLHRIERDHFFEIQHAVDMLFAPDGLFPPSQGGEELAMHEDLASWVVLSVWLNDTRNLYPVRASFNQRKKKIALDGYFPGPSEDPDLKAYREAPVHSKEEGDRTVARNLMDWASSMAMYGNDARAYPDHNLVAFLGNKICERMQWGWLRTASWTPPTAKALRR